MYYVPAKGAFAQQPQWRGSQDEEVVQVAAVNRRIRHAGTLKGTKKLHFVSDVGLDDGTVALRRYSCHQCQPCWDQQYDQCCHKVVTGPVWREKVKALSVASIPLTRSALAREGLVLSAAVQPGLESDSGPNGQGCKALEDVVAVEVASVNEPWMLGLPILLNGQGSVCHQAGKGVRAQDNWMGKVLPTDQVIWVQKLNPTTPGHLVALAHKLIGIPFCCRWQHFPTD